jgi:CubicO group peptidase (beta-lactamase class C family)
LIIFTTTSFANPTNAIAIEIASPKAAGISPVRIQEFKNELQRKVKAEEIPGAVLMVIRNGKIAVQESVGYRDRLNGLPMTIDTIFPAASMTKPIIAVAVMRLLEEGKIGLTDQVSKYIPEFKDTKVGNEIKNSEGKNELELVNMSREITIQDLMRHTSGLTYGYFDNTLVDKTYIENNIYDPNQTLEQQIIKLSKLPLKYQPGSTWNYGLSFDVLGRVIEIITKKSLDQAVKDLVTNPLKMKDTEFWVEESKYSRVAFSSVPAAKWKYTPAKTKPTLLSGGIGISTTALDYSRFCQMLLNNGQLDGIRLLSRKSVELMTANHLPPGVQAAKVPNSWSNFAPRTESGLGFGLGFAVRTEQGRSGLLGSPGEYFWLGASGSNFIIEPAEKMVIILMIAQSDKGVENLQLMRNMGNAIIDN